MSLGRKPRNGIDRIVIALLGVAAVVVTAGWLLAVERTRTAEPIAPASSEAPDELFPVHIHRPDGPPRVVTDKVDFRGQPVTVSCASCHTTTKPNPATKTTADLDEFHQGLQFAHGDLNCLSCHNADNYDTLRRADGSSIAYVDVMDLCGQCHGSQLRDYRNGAHGGMTGHWDLTKGERQRNNCIDCHDPHVPKYPLVQPVFAPASTDRAFH
jgi:hypothetical protein